MINFQPKFLLMRFAAIISLVALSLSYANAQNKKTAIVDANGILRWNTTKEEIKGFGVNYTLPFAYAYRNALKKGLKPEALIDEDVYHFARLGFDLYRVHVWDCEISDTLGNLLQNEHLRLFDYLLFQLKKRNIRSVITPIAYWGNGWPEPDEQTPGFSSKYGKDKCLTNADAVKAQQNYLYQFLNHVNPYTGLAYKDDDDIICFEISNEPHHRESMDSVRQFINGMVASMRKTGCKKPILYNISHSVQSADAYFTSNIQGGTFQWYPTGLGSRHELGGNLLPNVDAYTIPYSSDPRFKKQAKIVYEFDAADVGRSYIYPAMARSFREAGMQLATHFAYDPTYSAYANTEYGTHYMNLLYTPQKALALKICSEIFHTIPLYKKFGGYPVDTLFDGYRISYEKDLAEYVSAEKFIYTNSTATVPLQTTSIKEIAGYGNSSLVQYNGTGAYFLDKLSDGVWRLEVLPDAVWINDPFGKTSLDKPVGILKNHNRPIHIHLPNLGSQFSVYKLAGNEFQSFDHTTTASFEITPGTYVLTNKSSFEGLNTTMIGSIKINEGIQTKSAIASTYVLHTPEKEITAGTSLTINATIVSVTNPEKVELYIQTPGNWFEKTELKPTEGYNYSTVIPAEKIKEGFAEYYIIVTDKNGITTYPGGIAKHAYAWDFYGTETYRVSVVTSSAPIYLFEAGTDADEVSREWRRGNQLLPLAETGKAELLFHISSLQTKDSENPKAEQPADYSIRYFFGKKISGRSNDINNKSQLIIKARSVDKSKTPLQVALITKHGLAYGGMIELNDKTNEYTISIKDLKQVSLVTLPRPYPGFLNYFFQPSIPVSFNLTDVESIQISVGPGINRNELNSMWSFAVESIRLQ
jgi:hypothetical protein